MLLRTNDKEAARPAEPLNIFGEPKPPPLPRSTILPRTDPASSVIGSDMTIIGSGLVIVSQGTLQIDGEVRGDVIGSKVIISQQARVTGLVNAESVIVEGKVYGTIKAVELTLKASSHVEGDIHHRLLTLEPGAKFEGYSRRPEDQAELMPDLSTATQSAPPPEQQPPEPASESAAPDSRVVSMISPS